MFLDTFFLVALSCIIKSKCSKDSLKASVSFLDTSSQGPTPLFGELLKVLNFLTHFQENSNSSMSFSRHTRTCAFSSLWPKTCAMWVRKEPKT